MLRPALETDLENLLAWRNQDANRQVSTQQAPITAEQHARWWHAVSTDPSRRVLVLEVDNSPCGVVTFFNLRSDHGRRRGAWGFHLDHDGLAERGATLVVWQRAMREALDHAFGELDLDVLEAEVLEDNEVVRRANRRLGFTEGPVEDRPDPTTHAVRRVVPVALNRENRRRSRREPGATTTGGAA